MNKYEIMEVLEWVSDFAEFGVPTLAVQCPLKNGGMRNGESGQSSRMNNKRREWVVFLEIFCVWLGIHEKVERKFSSSRMMPP